MGNREVYDGLLGRLARAEQLHPVFAVGVPQGIGRITEEVGELARAVNHMEGEDRIMSEAWDVLVTAWRFVRRDWEQEG